MTDQYWRYVPDRGINDWVVVLLDLGEHGELLGAEVHCPGAGTSPAARHQRGLARGGLRDHAD